MEGRFYTASWLNFYCRYAYVSKYLSLDDQVIVELGAGSGKQAELLKKAHPGLTIVIFDLPTQLYVCNQYLSKVFEGTEQVSDYYTGREVSSLKNIERGKINILPHWKFHILRGEAFDLLWNAASLQEMAPETAELYLRDAGECSYMYLMHNIKYKSNYDSHVSYRGVISDSQAMKSFCEIDRTVANLVHNTNEIYFDSMWRNESH